MSRWLLYVDESGNFERPDETVCIGGLLLQDDPAQKLPFGLRSGIEKVYPHVLYPPHASELNLAAGHLAAWRMQRTASAFTDLLEEADRKFESAREARGRDPSLQGFLNPAGRHRKPEYEDLRKCDNWMRGFAPEAFYILQRVLSRSNDRMAKFLAFVSSSLLKQRRGCVLTGVVERGRHEWDGQLVPQDRYLEVLRTLFEEVFLFLRSRPGAGEPAHVVARIASRGIFDAARKLTTDDVRKVASDAAAFPLYPPAQGVDTVEIEPVVDRKYDGTAHPGVVIADFLSNRLRWAANGVDLGWNGFRSAVEKDTGMVTEIVPRVDGTGRTPRPAIAAHGASWLAITRAFAGQTMPTVPPGWGLDCVTSWSELAGGIR